jgi:N-formylglutamate amidohydrolase
MPGRRRDATANDSIVSVPVYTPDPHGAAMFAGVNNGTLGHLNGPRAVIDANRSPWHGWTQAPQRTTGAANIGAGRPSVPEGTRLDQERSSGSDPIQSIFEQRMAARRFS